MMKHLFMLLTLMASACFFSRADAQSLVNTNWKAFIGDPVNDTLVLHIRTDSSFVTDRAGNVVVRSLCKISGDTLTMEDYEGQFACSDMPGKYKVAQVNEVLVFTLIDDPCGGRAGALPMAKWKKMAILEGTVSRP